MTTATRPTFVLTIRPETRVIEPIRALRRALKGLLRIYGMRCVAIEEHHHGKEKISNPAASADRADARSCPTACATDRELGLASEQKRSSRSAGKHEGRFFLLRTRQSLATSRLPDFSHSQIRGSSARRSERDDPSLRRSSNGELKMSLGKRKGGAGDITPLLKFDARAGVFYRCDRTRAPDGEWYTEQKNVTEGLAAVFDMENVEVGWIAFSSGGPPSFVMFPVGSDIGNPPSDKHKQGFRLRLKLAKGGGVREFASTAASTWQAIDDKLHTEFEKERSKQPGKLPAVKLTGVKSSKTPMGTSYVPVFEITAWVMRPAELTTAPPEVADPADMDVDTELDDEVAA